MSAKRKPKGGESWQAKRNSKIIKIKSVRKGKVRIEREDGTLGRINLATVQRDYKRLDPVEDGLESAEAGRVKAKADALAETASTATTWIAAVPPPHHDPIMSMPAPELPPEPPVEPVEAKERAYALLAGLFVFGVIVGVVVGYAVWG